MRMGSYVSKGLSERFIETSPSTSVDFAQSSMPHLQSTDYIHVPEELLSDG